MPFPRPCSSETWRIENQYNLMTPKTLVFVFRCVSPARVTSACRTLAPRSVTSVVLTKSFARKRQGHRKSVWLGSKLRILDNMQTWARRDAGGPLSSAGNDGLVSYPGCEDGIEMKRNALYCHELGIGVTKVQSRCFHDGKISTSVELVNTLSPSSATLCF